MKINGIGEIAQNEEDILDKLRIDPSFDISSCCLENSQYNEAIHDNYSDFTPLKLWENIDTPEDFYESIKNTWLMPEYAKNFDIVSWLLSECKDQEELQRIGQELILYEERNLIPLLKYLKWMTDTLKKNGIVIGVGRGSSVSSFVLYKIGLHKINSLYWDLDISEFLKG
jgi:DNA polymerase-3 subunit alpha